MNRQTLTLEVIALGHGHVVDWGEGKRRYAIFSCMPSDEDDRDTYPDADRAFHDLEAGETPPMLAEAGRSYLVTGDWSSDRAFRYEEIREA